MNYGDEGKVVGQRYETRANGSFRFVRRFQISPGVWIEEDGWDEMWMTTDELRAAIKRWVARSYATKTPNLKAWYLERGYDTFQCDDCRFFGAFSSDYGLCCNPVSPHDGRVVSEHGGCEAHSERQKMIEQEQQEAHNAR